MKETIELIGVIIAFITLLLTVVGQALYVAHKLGKFEEKLENIEKKQDKHNGVIERTYKLETDVKVIQERQKVENHRIDDLEEVVK